MLERQKVKRLPRWKISAIVILWSEIVGVKFSGGRKADELCVQGEFGWPLQGSVSVPTLEKLADWIQ